MLHYLRYFILLGLICCNVLNAQQTQQGFRATPPNKAELITPVNIKPLNLEEFARRKGFSTENPARNIVILNGFGIIDLAATIFRVHWKKRPQVDEMENFSLILPRFADENLAKRVKLVDFLTGNGRAVGLVSDVDFECAAACEFISVQPEKLFECSRMALTLSDFTSEEARDKIVRNFSKRNIEYASNRKDLNRLFSAKAEKIVGIFKANHFSQPEDRTQPYFDELVTACLSRLTAEKNGFILLIGAKAAEKAAKEGRYVDMIEHLKFQEKVLHQINYFASGRKDTLVLLVQDSGEVQMTCNENFNLSEFLADIDFIFKAFKSESLKKYFFAIDRDKTRLIEALDLVKLKELVAENRSLDLSTYLQERLAGCYQLQTKLASFSQRIPGFAVFSRGYRTEAFRGLSTFDEFINHLALVTLSNKTNRE